MQQSQRHTTILGARLLCIWSETVARQVKSLQARFFRISARKDSAHLTHHQPDSDNSRRSRKWACKELLLTKDFCRDLGKTKTEYMDRGASEEIKPDCQWLENLNLNLKRASTDRDQKSKSTNSSGPKFAQFLFYELLLALRDCDNRAFRSCCCCW